MDKSTIEFLKTMNRFRFLKNRMKVKGPLSHAEHFMIGTIAECGEANEKGGGVTVSEVAKQLGATMAAVSKMLRGLENKGLITRTTSESDRRNVYIHLSDEGLRQQQEQVVVMETLVDRIITKMPEEDARKLNQLFTKFFEATKEVIEEDGEESC